MRGNDERKKKKIFFDENSIRRVQEHLSIYIINDDINFQLNRSNRLIINRMI